MWCSLAFYFWTSRCRRSSPLLDVMATGHHAAKLNGVEEGSTAVVIRDGCGTLRGSRRPAAPSLAGHPKDWLKIFRGLRRDAPDPEPQWRGSRANRGREEPSQECVGAPTSMTQAIQMVGPLGARGKDHDRNLTDKSPKRAAEESTSQRPDRTKKAS